MARKLGRALSATEAVSAGEGATAHLPAVATHAPWLAAVFLTLEASNVIGLRVMKMAAGGADALTEANLMVAEKVAAAFEMVDLVRGGGTPAMVIERYRDHVGANASRLKSGAGAG